MKKIINYEKDILFKTNIGEVCSISLEHDFTVDDGFLRGDFIVSGEYKLNELSINKENFSYRLPLEYELEPNIDLNTLSYDIDNFEYNVKNDELSVCIDFGVKFDEKKNEPIIPNITEEELNMEETVDGMSIYEIPQYNNCNEDIQSISDDHVELPKFSKEMGEDIRLREEEKDMVLNSQLEDDTYITYHVHIVREGESLESIAFQYNTTIELIKEYNDIGTLELKSKLIIPEIENE